MKNVLLACTLGLFFSLSGTHLIGSQFDYQYIKTLSNGSRQYKLNLVMTRDCGAQSIEFAYMIEIGIYDKQSSNLFKAIQVDLKKRVLLNSCYGFCIEEAIYETVIELPSNSSGYHVVHEMCCRGETKNIRLGQSGTPYLGTTTYCLIPGNMSNSSAFFSFDKYKMISPTLSDSSSFYTFDADGDSVVVEITPANSGSSVTNNYPNIPSMFPGLQNISNMDYNAGYSSSFPLGSTSVLKCDNLKKQIITQCNVEGRYTVAYAIKEYRNGALIATTIRETLIFISNTPKPGSPIVKLNGSGNLAPEVRLEWSLYCADNVFMQYVERSVNSNSNFIRIDSIDRGMRTYVDNQIALKTTYFYRIVPVGQQRNVILRSEEYQITLWALGLNGAMTVNSNQLNISPVPAKDFCRISLTEGFIKNYTVSDCTGRILYTNAPDTEMNACELDCSQWPAGIYCIQCITSGGEVFFKKIVKE